MRILIATVTAGGGHLQAAAALEEAWKLARPEDHVQRVDLLDFVSKLYKKIYAEAYIKLVAHAPELYGLVFKKTDNPKLAEKLSDFRRGLARHSYRRFVRHLREFQPDAVLCPHYLPLEVLGGLTGDGPLPFVSCVITDFEAHALWLESCVDLYCVAAPQTKASLMARRIPEEKVAVTGIPISLRFSSNLNRREIRKRYGLRSDLPVLLVLSGGFGMGPVAEILAQLDRVSTPFQTLVVAGKNADLREELAAQDRVHPTDVFGFVTNMHEWMAVADLIISKPGGLTTSEALALGKPLLIINPIPGQETANSDYLLENGAAVKINRLHDLPPRLDELLSSGKLRLLSRNAKRLGAPNAATEICRAICARLQPKDVREAESNPAW